MSKWINTEKFEQFKEERENDQSAPSDSNVSYARKWPNPKMGSQNKPKEYHTRLIPDLKGNFYKKFYYHMFQSGENWNFIMCPKTHDMDAFCPWCALTQILYQGSDADKRRAYKFKRKEKFVGNVFVVRDPRDVDEQDPDKHYTGKTFLYEFPATIEQLIRKEVTDIENGWGYKIFDPEDGHNLIISIGAKKPDKDGKVWPDYSLTTFAKKPSSIGDNVDEIMNTTQDIIEYLDKSMKTNEEHIELLKSEMVYEDVQEQVERFMPIEGKKKTESKSEEKVEENPPWKEDDPSSGSSDDDKIEDNVSNQSTDDDIDDLLKDL